MTFTEELGLDDFQVNTPFPGGPASEMENAFQLESGALAEFLGSLFDIWIERGYGTGVSLGPFDALIDHFTGRPARLPCIWKENCSNQFISVDAKGTVAQCDCWVTSYPESFFGNIFREPDLTRMLSLSPARRKFVERPKRLVEDEDCLSCRYLSICHGGCPVRAYSALGSMTAKDPYCEVYKVVFARAETHGSNTHPAPAFRPVWRIRRTDQANFAVRSLLGNPRMPRCCQFSEDRKEPSAGLMGLRGPHLPASRSATDKLGDTARAENWRNPEARHGGIFNSLLERD